MKRKNPPRLSIENAQTLAAKIEWEGDLCYVLENWNFSDFKDKKFTSLRKAFIKAKTDLENYCALERVDELEDEAPQPFDAGQGIDDDSDYENICDKCGNPAGDEHHICT